MREVPGSIPKIITPLEAPDRKIMYIIFLFQDSVIISLTFGCHHTHAHRTTAASNGVVRYRLRRALRPDDLEGLREEA